MSLQQLRPLSHLFAVRLWAEDLGDGQIEWRGRVTHVLSGEVRSFREPSELADFLRQIVQSRVATPPEAPWHAEQP